MVRNYPVKLLLILTLAIQACGSPAASDTPTAAPVQEATAAPANISTDQLQNAQYQLGTRDDHAVVQLVDGVYQQGTDVTTADYAYIVLSDYRAIGDVNGDGVDEAAAVFFENYGGSGDFAMLAIYSNVNGSPVFLTSTLIDDRPTINQLDIENGEVALNAITHGTDDPACCPELPTIRQYALVNNQLRIVNYITRTPSEVKRIIEIAAPVNGAEASGSVQVTGTISIAPFENNLTYSISDEAGNELASGPVAVTAPDLGAAGTFDATIPLDAVPAGTTIYLEIQDISAADSSWLAMDAVKLLVK